MSVLTGIRCNYATLSVAGTVNVSTGPCFLHNVNFNDTTAGTLTIKDGTAVTSATVAVLLCGTPGTQFFDVDCGTGLSAITSGNNKVTLSYAKI
jgi:hypothetical protein